MEPEPIGKTLWKEVFNTNIKKLKRLIAPEQVNSAEESAEALNLYNSLVLDVQLINKRTLSLVGVPSPPPEFQGMLDERKQILLQITPEFIDFVNRLDRDELLTFVSKQVETQIRNDQISYFFENSSKSKEELREIVRNRFETLWKPFAGYSAF